MRECSLARHILVITVRVPVITDRHRAQSGSVEFLQPLFEQNGVRSNYRFYANPNSVFDELGQIGMQERFPAVEPHCGEADGGRVREQAVYGLRSKLLIRHVVPPVTAPYAAKVTECCNRHRKTLRSRPDNGWYGRSNGMSGQFRYAIQPAQHAAQIGMPGDVMPGIPD